MHVCCTQLSEVLISLRISSAGCWSVHFVAPIARTLWRHMLHLCPALQAAAAGGGRRRRRVCLAKAQVHYDCFVSGHYPASWRPLLLTRRASTTTDKTVIMHLLFGPKQTILLLQQSTDSRRLNCFAEAQLTACQSIRSRLM